MKEWLNTKFNLNDPELISVIDEVPFWSAPFGLKLLDLIHYKKNLKALDIGFGTGFPLTEVAMRLGNSSEVFGIDPWIEGIKRTKKKLKIYGISNVELKEGIAENLPFNNNFFDLIISNNGLNNVNDLNKVLSECNRVQKIGGQLVFNFNGDKSFIEFYNVYKEILTENNLEEFIIKINEHIYSKRKPLAEVEELLRKNGYKISQIVEDKFYYRFADGTTMLNDFFIKLAFLESWKNIIPEKYCEKIFGEIENRLNQISETKNCLSMQVPFYTIDSVKEKNI